VAIGALCRGPPASGGGRERGGQPEGERNGGSATVARNGTEESRSLAAKHEVAKTGGGRTAIALRPLAAFCTGSR